ncbi:MAG: divalent-cation tolerance protein CutA [Planctomycetes bacterium]|nr:divalent-cation tolerance protein CutA [Planctomycetota bacterium]
MARSLVEERFAACVNIIPKVASVYRWEEGVTEDEEQLLVIKTTADRLDGLIARVVQLHTYDVPEVIALPLVAGHSPYLAWLTASVVPLPPVLRPSEPEETPE